MVVQLNRLAALAFVLVSVSSARGASPALEALDHRLTQAGLVDVQSLDPELQVALRLASADNVLGEAVYGSLRACYLQRAAAEKLVAAARALRRRQPNLRLRLADCLRPRDVQRRMWALVVGTARQPYVADPAFGSMHNYGVAVDVTLADVEGREVDMGSPLHHFGDLSQPRYEDRLLAARRLAPAQVSSRRLLREVMHAAGFRGISNEWWHFDALDKRVARQTLPIIESLEVAIASGD